MTSDELIDGVMTFEEKTGCMRVAVQSYYLANQSKPNESQYVWAYRIQISNDGARTVQLKNRHWIITDGRGLIKEVKGAGVIGEEPCIAPGESFTYTSGTPLSTPSGFMTGSYNMVTPDDDKYFDIAVPTFSLDSPHSSSGIN